MNTTTKKTSALTIRLAAGRDVSVDLRVRFSAHAAAAGDLDRCCGLCGSPLGACTVDEIIETGKKTASAPAPEMHCA